MFRNIFRALRFLSTYPAPGSVESFPLPPGTTPEDAQEIMETIAAIRNAPSIADEDRNPPPPWLNPTPA